MWKIQKHGEMQASMTFCSVRKRENELSIHELSVYLLISSHENQINVHVEIEQKQIGNAEHGNETNKK